MRDCCVDTLKIGEKIGNTARKKPTLVGLEPVAHRRLLMTTLRGFLNITLWLFAIGFLGVWFSRRSRRARSYLHSCRENRGSRLLLATKYVRTRMIRDD